MGCCNSNIRKATLSELVFEERIIQTAEKQLFFASRSLPELLNEISSLSLDQASLQSLCEYFKVPFPSPSAAFLQNLIQKNLMTAELLKNLAVLLANHGEDANPFLLSNNKETLIEKINELITVSIDVIPNNLQAIEGSALAYAENLKPVASVYLRDLEACDVQEIFDKVKDVLVSSKSIRVKMHADLQKLRESEGLDQKLDNFRTETEPREESLNGVSKLRDGKSEKDDSKIEFLADRSGNIEEKIGKNNEENKKSEEKTENSEENIEKGEEHKLKGLKDVEIEIQIHNETEKVGLNESTPLTDLGPDLDSSKTQTEEVKFSKEEQSEIIQNHFSISNELQSPELALKPRRSSGLAAKLKATQALIQGMNPNSPANRNSTDGQAFMRRKVPQESFTKDRKSLTSAKPDETSTGN